MISVSLIILTCGRWKAVERSLTRNLYWAGCSVDELIHVDNSGSESLIPKWFAERFDPAVQIINNQNLGVAKGYNRGLAMATSSHVVITGCDRIMPKDWLGAMIDAAQAIPNTGVISVYSPPRFGETNHDGRLNGSPKTYGSLVIQPASACEARFHSRDFLMGAGFFREDFGLYGYEDCEWRDRAQSYADANGLINYIIPSLGYAEHIDDGRGNYEAVKKEQAADPRKPKLVKWCHDRGNPHYNPYCRIERDRLKETECT